MDSCLERVTSSNPRDRLGDKPGLQQPDIITGFDVCIGEVGDLTMGKGGEKAMRQWATATTSSSRDWSVSETLQQTRTCGSSASVVTWQVQGLLVSPEHVAQRHCASPVFDLTAHHWNLALKSCCHIRSLPTQKCLCVMLCPTRWQGSYLPEAVSYFLSWCCRLIVGAWHGFLPLWFFANIQPPCRQHQNSCATRKKWDKIRRNAKTWMCRWRTPCHEAGPLLLWTWLFCRPLRIQAHSSDPILLLMASWFMLSWTRAFICLHYHAQMDTETLSLARR